MNNTILEYFKSDSTQRKEALEYAISYLKAYEATIAAAAEKAEALSTAISSACASE